MGRQRVDPWKDISEEDLKLILLIHGALAGACVAAVVQISSREQLSLPLLVSLSCFAITIPISLLVVLLINYRLMVRFRIGEAESRRTHYWPDSGFIQALRYIAYTGGFGGFLTLFWNFHAVIGLIFLFTTAISLGIALIAEQFKSRQIISGEASDKYGTPSVNGEE